MKIRATVLLPLALVAALTACAHKAPPDESAAPAASGKLVTLPDGLKYSDQTVGTGPALTTGEQVSMLYTGRLADGTVFDSTAKRNDEPFQFHLGTGEVIKGWDEGIATMHVGGKRRLIIPPSLGYGATGAGGVIPPNATLTFDVQVLGATP